MMVAIRIKIAVGRKDWRRLAQEREQALSAAQVANDQLRKELTFQRQRADAAEQRVVELAKRTSAAEYELQHLRALKGVVSIPLLGEVS
jgi:hypothetical protein